MRVAIVGGTGFCGAYLVEALLERGHTPVLLVRPGSEDKIRRPTDCDLMAGDVEVIGDLVNLLKNCEAVIYTVGILREYRNSGVTFEALQYRGVVRLAEAAKACRVKRLLLMSANGIKANGTPYQATKFRAEQHALNSGMDVTVFRPSVVFGEPHGTIEIATQLYRDMIAPPLPAIGFFNAFGPNKGEFAMSPVHAVDVADAFASALEDPSTIGNTYTLAGPEELTWREMLRRVAKAAGRNKWILPMPVELMKLLAAVFDRIPAFPVTRDQLTMLAEGNTGDASEIAAVIGRAPRAFDADSLSYLVR